MTSIEANKPPPFDPHSEPTSVGQRWKRWVKNFERYVVAAGISDDLRKKALLLNIAGNEVSEIYDNSGDETTTYAALLAALNTTFDPQRNIFFETFKFRKARQLPSESFSEFYARLRSFASTCDFKDRLNFELTMQILVGTHMESLQKKILGKADITLDQVLEFGRTEEAVSSQSIDLKKGGDPDADVRQVSASSRKDRKFTHKKKPSKPQEKVKKRECFQCGEDWPHDKKQPCRAKDHQCTKCSRWNHLEKMCRTKPKEHVDYVGGKSSTESDCSSDSSVSRVRGDDGKLTSPRTKIELLGRKIKVVIDTGCCVNIIGADTYGLLKNPPPLKNTKKRLFPYQSKSTLGISGKFSADVRFKLNSTKATFYVVEGQGESLLGFGTAQELGIVQILGSITTDTVVQKFPSVFEGTGKFTGRQMQIHVDPNIAPVAQLHNRIPFHLRDKLDDEIKRLQKADIIEPASGPTPWVSPVVLVPKPHKPDQLRLCIDMRAANKAVLRERHQLPTIDDLVTAVNGSVLFSKLDLREGFHQFELCESSRGITTFYTHNGLWRYKRLFFGITSAPEIFQDTIRQLIAPVKNAINVSDDILIFGKSQREHDRALEAVLEILASAGLTLNRDKCQFSADKLSFFGYEFSEKGLRADPRKIEAIDKLSPPANKDEVHSFLGTVAYCGRFVPNLSAVSAPLRALIKNKTPWIWEEKEQSSFNELRKILRKNLTNEYFNPNHATELIVDAGPDGLGAILAQPKDNVPGIVAYGSRSLTDTEKGYSQVEKEMLAVVWAVEKYRLYLLGSHFRIVTDHKPLLGVFTSMRETTPRLERLRLKLQGYDYDIVHRPGSTNPSDYFSRHPTSPPSKSKSVEKFVNFLSDEALPSAIPRKTLAKHTNNDPVLNLLKVRLKSPTQSDLNDALQPYKHIISVVSVTEDGILLRGSRIILPSSLQKRVFHLMHRGHPGMVRTKQLLRSRVWFPGMDSFVEGKIKECLPCLAVTPKKQRDPIRATTLPARPWSELSIDFAGPFPDGKYILAMIDEHSRYPLVDVVSSTSAASTLKVLRRWFTEFGVPAVLKSDNGPPFNSKDYTTFLANWGVTPRHVTPYWPEANGTSERFFRTIKKTVQAAILERKNWQEELDAYLMNYRNTPHASTGCSPVSLIFRQPFSIGYLPSFAPAARNLDVEAHDLLAKQKMASYANEKRHAAPHGLLPSELVLVKQPQTNKFTSFFDPIPYEVVSVNGNQITATRLGQTITRNSSFFKRINPAAAMPDFGDVDGPLSGNNASDIQSLQPTNEEGDCPPKDATDSRLQPPKTPPSLATPNPLPERPSRSVRPPERFKDFVLPPPGRM